MRNGDNAIKRFSLLWVLLDDTSIMVKLHPGRACTISGPGKTPRNGPVRCHNCLPCPAMPFSPCHVWLSYAPRKGKTISLRRLGVQANQACTLEKLRSAMLAPYSSLFPKPLPSVLGIPQKLQRESVAGKNWGRPWKVGLPRMPRQATLSSALWESRLVSSESWFSPNRRKQRGPRRSEINAALTLFCICKRTWIKKDSKCACIRSALSCQTRGPRYGCETDTVNSRAYKRGLP